MKIAIIHDKKAYGQGLAQAVHGGGIGRHRHGGSGRRRFRAFALVLAGRTALVAALGLGRQTLIAAGRLAALPFGPLLSVVRPFRHARTCLSVPASYGLRRG